MHIFTLYIYIPIYHLHMYNKRNIHKTLNSFTFKSNDSRHTSTTNIYKTLHQGQKHRNNTHTDKKVAQIMITLNISLLTHA